MLDFSSVTDVGDRDINEDSYACISADNLYGFIVCDGLGGHGLGDVASRTVVDTFVSFIKNDYFLGNHSFENFFKEANFRLLQGQKEKSVSNKMKTTAAAVVFKDNVLYCSNIGDTRIYVFKDNNLTNRSIDHSVTGYLALSGAISDGEIRSHPDKNRLLRALGDDAELMKFDCFDPIHLQHNMAVLICSDGFWELIKEDDICLTLSESKSSSEWLERMMELLKPDDNDKKKDNITAITIRI